MPDAGPVPASEAPMADLVVAVVTAAVLVVVARVKDMRGVVSEAKVVQVAEEVVEP